MGHGSLLAGRYRLGERVRTGAGGSVWRALDETLDRPVSVRVLPPGHPHTADVADAARRAALVEDPRLVRILDVGHLGEPGRAGRPPQPGQGAYIVAEHLVGRVLEEVLGSGPLPAETARSLVGEAAQALDRASARGLHHLRLTPASLVISPDGSVKVLGTAVEAALAGLEQSGDPGAAERADAVGLTQVLYAALTGLWPGAGAGEVTTLAAAPAVGGRAVPPGDLVAGIPNDLDTLVSVTLGPHDDGPRTPGELAGQLAPWARAEPLSDPRGLTLAGPGRPATDRITSGGELTVPGEFADGDQPDRTGLTAGAAGAAGVPEVVTTGAALATTPSGPPQQRPAARHATPRSLRTAVTDSAPPALFSPSSGPSPGLPAAAAPPQPAPSAPVPSAAAPSTSGPAPAGSGMPAAGPAPGAPSAFDEWSLLGQPQPAGPRPATAPLRGLSAEDDVPLGPFIPSAPIARPPRDQAQFVIVLVAGLVVLGLVLAVLGLIGMGRPAPLVGSGPLVPTLTPSAGAVPGTSARPTAAGSGGADAGSGPGSPSGSASPSASGEAATISGIEAIDPQGDGQEGGGAAPKAIDGDSATVWRSDRYASAQFGGLKQGLGLYLRLSHGLVSKVTVTLVGTGGTVELRSASSPGYDGSTLIASADARDGTVVLTPPQPVEADSLLLWFTSLPQQSNGEYRLLVSEITLS